MKYAIEIEKLTKAYKKPQDSTEHIALQELDLIIPQGCIFGLLGPNGAGKSTLINILAGSVIKSSGKVKISDIDIDCHPKLARSKIGIVPQEVTLDSFFTLYQALEFTAGYYGIRPAQRKTEEILQALSLFDKREAFPRQLSGGMKRRFMIAKAMVHSPKVLILDEPTAGVDIELREQLWKYVRSLNSQGTTVIITTHYLAEAEEMCNHIAFINNGKIIEQGTKDNLLNTLGTRYIDIEFTEPFKEKVGNFTADYNAQILADNKIRLQYNASGQSLNTILADLQATGINVKDLQITQPDLEGVFKKLIG